MSTSVSWKLTCVRSVFRPGEVKDSHPLNTTETGDKLQPPAPWNTRLKDLALALLIRLTPNFGILLFTVRYFFLYRTYFAVLRIKALAPRPSRYESC